MSADARPAATRTRRRADGRPSARALLLSLLGQHVVPDGGEAWTSTLVAAFEALGVEEKAARQALARSEAAGWLTHETQGRYSRWQVTATGRRLVATAAERLTRAARPAPWDGRWVLVSAQLAGADRQSLDARLRFEGFGVLSPGLWVAFARDAEVGAREALRDLVGGDGQVFRAELDGDPASLVRRAWDLDAAEAANEAFLRRFARVDLDSDRSAFAVAALLGHEWQELQGVSPDLPEALQPRGWKGGDARARFSELYRATVAPSRKFYTRLTDDVSV